MVNKKLLYFGQGNRKLAKNVATFSIPAGHSCPFAKDCCSYANRITGKLTDGMGISFRCYAATQEAIYSTVRNCVWHNYDLLQKNNDVKYMGKLIQSSLPLGVNIVRIHVSGDYFTEKYFLAWLNVALNNPFIIFYGYTKALPFLVKYKKYIPSNFRLTASKGGTHDHLITKHNLNYCEVVFSIKEAEEKGLEIDKNDRLAMAGNKSFAILIHSSQPAGSTASKAVSNLRKLGLIEYDDPNPASKFITYVTLNKLNKIQLPYNLNHINKVKNFIIGSI